MNSAIVSFVDAVLLRNPPFRSPAELMVLAEHFGSIESFSFSTPAFAALKENDTVTGLSGFRPWRFRTTIHGESQLTNGQLVSGAYFSLLGVRPHLGRTLTEQDNQAANAVAVLSFRYWEREFNSDAGVIGRTIDLQGYQFSIVGVTEPEFFGLEPGKEVEIVPPLQPVVMPAPLPHSPLMRSGYD
jgi:hypothetical protein